jgi:chorismate mutase
VANIVEPVNLSELRERLDQMNERIISGLKARSKYPCNLATFEEKFYGYESWVIYRLKREQDIDSEFGRFLYPEQIPFIYLKNQLTKPKVKGPVTLKGIKPIHIDLSKEIIQLYKSTLCEICTGGNNPNTYGETTKIDVNNLLELNERILGLGENVAYYKINKNPELLKISSREELRKLLLVPEREKEVLTKTVLYAHKYEFPHLEAIKNFTQKLIDLTTTAEIEFILKAQKNGFKQDFEQKTSKV